jgi:hypothetical protein
MVLSSHASNDAAGKTWPRCDVDVESCWRQCCRVKLATTLLGRHDRDKMYMPCHASDDAVGVNWS